MRFGEGAKSITRHRLIRRSGGKGEKDQRCYVEDYIKTHVVSKMDVYLGAGIVRGYAVCVEIAL